MAYGGFEEEGLAATAQGRVTFYLKEASGKIPDHDQENFTQTLVTMPDRGHIAVELEAGPNKPSPGTKHKRENQVIQEGKVLRFPLDAKLGLFP